MVMKTAVERGSPPDVPASPNSRLVRHRRPHLQGRVMEQVFVGIDVAKDRLDVHVKPSGESFIVSRDGEGLASLVDRLKQLAPRLIVLEATGGFEVTVAAALAAAGLPLTVVNPRQIREFARLITCASRKPSATKLLVLHPTPPTATSNDTPTSRPATARACCRMALAWSISTLGLRSRKPSAAA